MAETKDTKRRSERAVHTGGMAAEGELGTAGSGRKPGNASTIAGAATDDEEEALVGTSTARDQVHRGRGTGIKDAPRDGKSRAEPE
jgi:hypothetical protein